jgi:formiminotetrahydrofolate cyclodeaminase
MAHLTSLTVTELLDAFASSDPLPAGGSASALAGAAGASLLMMASTLPKTRSGDPGEAAELAAAVVQLRPLRDALIALIDRDTDAYSQVLVAFRAPRGTAEEQARRRDQILIATRLATEVPLEMMRVARQALRSAVSVAGNASRAAGSDVSVGVELLLAALRGAGGSVSSNLSAIRDSEYVERIDAERQRLDAESSEDAARARAAL